MSRRYIPTPNERVRRQLLVGNGTETQVHTTPLSESGTPQDPGYVQVVALRIHTYNVANGVGIV